MAFAEKGRTTRRRPRFARLIEGHQQHRRGLLEALVVVLDVHVGSNSLGDSFSRGFVLVLWPKPKEGAEVFHRPEGLAALVHVEPVYSSTLPSCENSVFAVSTTFAATCILRCSLAVAYGSLADEPLMMC